jgi:hypothetical protein
MALVGWSVAQRNAHGEVGLDLDLLRQQLKIQRDELDQLKSSAETGNSAINIERAAQQQLLSRVRALELENAALKEDQLLFERLIPGVDERPPSGSRISVWSVTVRSVIAIACCWSISPTSKLRNFGTA